MKVFKFIALFLFIVSNGILFGQDKDKITDEELLKLYKGLRVADVADGLDMVGLRDATILDQRIVALWKDIDDLSHIFSGIAVTARYVPTNKIVKNPMGKEEFQKWEGNWYNTMSDEPYVKYIKEGSVVVLDVDGDGDTGSVGSYNSLDWFSRGARGIVSNGGISRSDG